MDLVYGLMAYKFSFALWYRKADASTLHSDDENYYNQE
jgi:hypothetical protein